MAVVKGRSRGNGAQLANYLEHNKENEQVHILDIRGTCKPGDLKSSLLEMSLTSELTKGYHGLYHSQFSPAIGEDKTMTPEEWLEAADIIERHLKLEGQKRVIVLHEKKGRIHAHIVWERYDHISGRLKADNQNYKKHDAAREEIERHLGHKFTPQKENRKAEKQPEKDHKKILSDLWTQAKDGKSFVSTAEKAGYQISVTEDRRPWRVIFKNGDKIENIDLVRQLRNVKTKEVTERLHPLRSSLRPLPEALEAARGADTHANQSSQTRALAKLAGQNFSDVQVKPAQPGTSFKDQLDAFRRNKDDQTFNRTQLLKFAAQSRDDIFAENVQTTKDQQREGSNYEPER